MTYLNSWDNDVRSASYATLEFPNTYYLAYRDLPQITQKYAKGSKALDFGCGTGRSTRFVKNLGFDTTGIDISASMFKKARELDPEGIYHLVKDGDYRSVPDETFNLITSIFTFDNIPGLDHRVSLLKALKNKLAADGCIVMLDANARMYTREWASFTTLAFPENRHARSGEKVKICMTDVDDQSPVDDYLFTIADYHELFERAGLKLAETFQPLGKPDEPYLWKSELTIAPWIIYVLTY
jgi:cyclopropane fatty-acyl-phospholipid synthase-like methyltransferase